MSPVKARDIEKYSSEVGTQPQLKGLPASEICIRSTARKGAGGRGQSSSKATTILTLPVTSEGILTSLRQEALRLTWGEFKVSTTAVKH
jgi:hypothetical protein